MFQRLCNVANIKQKQATENNSKLAECRCRIRFERERERKVRENDIGL